jgi:hypothetical protein
MLSRVVQASTSSLRRTTLSGSSQQLKRGLAFNPRASNPTPAPTPVPASASSPSPSLFTSPTSRENPSRTSHPSETESGGDRRTDERWSDLLSAASAGVLQHAASMARSGDPAVRWVEQSRMVFEGARMRREICGDAFSGEVLCPTSFFSTSFRLAPILAHPFATPGETSEPLLTSPSPLHRQNRTHLPKRLQRLLPNGRIDSPSLVPGKSNDASE